MFFVLSKTLDVLVEPVVWVALLLAASLLFLARDRRRAGLLTLAAGLATLLVLSLPPVANRLWSSLENEVQPTVRDDVTYDAVIVLGGVFNPHGSTPGMPAYGDGVDRVTVASQLLRAGRARVAIVSGGAYDSSGVNDLPTEGELLRRSLVEWGIAPERIVVEGEALNTRQNATLVKALVEARGLRTLLLVTSAFHMPRAAGCFRAVGLEVDLLPVDYRMRDPSRDVRLLPRTEALADTAKTVRERVGLLVYRLMGYAR